MSSRYPLKPAARDDLLFTITFALGRSKLVPKPNRGPDMTKAVALDIINQLELSRFVVMKEDIPTVPPVVPNMPKRSDHE